MKKIIVVSLVCLNLLSSITCNAYSIGYPQQSVVYVYPGNHNHSSLAKILDEFNINYQLKNNLSNEPENLCIIFDVGNVDTKNLPKHYIAYQNTPVPHGNTNKDLLTKFSQAIAVWDLSQKNIDSYSSKIHNYHYLPEQYEFADPVILPCFLPTEALAAYKQILTYSNQHDSDISSHLPTLFVHTLLQNPNILIEAGVSYGQSTKAFRHILDFCKTQLIGVDIYTPSKSVYANIKGALFLLMSDVDFMDYYLKSPYKSTKIDAIFIDTSHTYEHTKQEIQVFAPLLSERGLLMFHDSNVTPLNNGTGYLRLNKTAGHAIGNTRGVTEAIKELFNIEFNEHAYVNTTFARGNSTWHIIHYPFCNGLTLLKKV